MAYKNNNTKLTQEVKAITGLSELTGYPQQISESIIPVIQLNNKFVNIQARGSGTATGGITVYTAPTDRDFYLTGFTLALTKDVTSDLVNYYIGFTPDGKANERLVDIYFQTTTVVNGFTLSRDFTVPIKIQRGTSITLTGSFAAGTCTKSCCILGYVTEITGD